MENKRIKTSAELLADRSWTEFLKHIPIGETDWRVCDYRDFISLRTIASILSNKDKSECDRRFSIRQDANDKSVYYINAIIKE